MDGAKVNIIEFFYDKENGVFTLNLHIWILLASLFIYFIIRFLIKRYRKRNGIDRDVQPIKLKYKLGGVEVEYEIIRSYQNIEIAHRVYVELITRKAAIEIEEDKDVIVEVYNSWYSLFQTTRNELKLLNGKLLKDNDTSTHLIKLLTDILNIGLRPHLTKYQAKFRKWYSEQLDINKDDSPQIIQSTYEDIDSLMASMKEVNKMLIDYSKQLKKIVHGTTE